jgi:hypothetical protein
LISAQLFAPRETQHRFGLQTRYAELTERRRPDGPNVASTCARSRKIMA